MEINIYQAAEGKLVSVVIKLLEKAYASGQKSVFFSPISERIDLIDKTLWTFSTNAFIPHGSYKFGFPEKQPIYFTNKYENPNDANILAITDTLEIPDSFMNNFEKIMFIFEEMSQVEYAHEFYQVLKKNCKYVNYWKQSANGWIKDL